MNCKKLSKDAILPFKSGPNEIGYDLTLIRKIKDIDEYTIMYDTDICIQPPDGYYTEIIPRSSIIKTGWFLANSIGIIDPTYRDSLKIVLKRVDPYQKEIVLPNRLCQLVVRPIYNQFEVYDVNELSETYRKGGFGSTNV
jgi:dUTP pyrophosphatase